MYLLGVNSPIDWSKKGHSPKQCVSLTFKGNGNCGLTVHNPGAHLADYVQGWGPLWAWSTFGFEDMNGTIMDLTHGTGNVCRQVLLTDS